MRKTTIASLVDGEEEGFWTLDRCHADKAQLGEVIMARHVFRRTGSNTQPTKDSPQVPRQTTLAGYELGVLAKSRTGGTVSMSVACGSAWLGKGDDPSRNTPEADTGATGRHNTFDFDLKTGRAKLLPVIPLTARDGGVKLLVWLPKAAGAPQAAEK